MLFRGNFIIFTFFALLSFAAANPFHHIYESFQSKPAEFLFNSSIVIFLLVIGGILAGTITISSNSVLFKFH